MNVNLKYTPKSSTIADVVGGQYFETHDGSLFKYLGNDIVINLDTMATQKLNDSNKRDGCTIVDIDLHVSHTRGAIRFMDVDFDRYFGHQGQTYKRVRYVGAVSIHDMVVHEFTDQTKVTPVTIEEINITATERNEMIEKVQNAN